MKSTQEHFNNIVRNMRKNEIQDSNIWKSNFRIAIKFGDNDFYYTFLGVLKNLDAGIEHFTDSTFPKFNKENWCDIINDLALGSYYLWQNRFEYDVNKTKKKKYLKVTPSRIFLNEEVDEYVSKSEWTNSETFILDRRKLGKERIISF